MTTKILTKNGIDNTFVDGARFYNCALNGRSGIVSGSLNGGSLIKTSSNSVTLDTCELIISGFRVLLTEAYTGYIPATSEDVEYVIVAQIVVNQAGLEIAFGLDLQKAPVTLEQDNIFSTENGRGTYQIEIGRFTMSSDGVKDLVRTVDILGGGDA